MVLQSGLFGGLHIRIESDNVGGTDAFLYSGIETTVLQAGLRTSKTYAELFVPDTDIRNSWDIEPDC